MRHQGVVSAPSSLATPTVLGDRNETMGMALGFVAGFVDSAGFIALAGLFTSHVTGNFVLLGAQAVSAGQSGLAKLLVLPVFMAAVAAARLFSLLLEGRHVDPLRPLVLGEIALLCAFLIFGVKFADRPGSLGLLLAGLLGVAAMGVQAAIGRVALKEIAATTVMTVNVTQTVIDAVDLCLNRRSSTHDESARRFRRLVPIVLAFATGAMSGAAAVAVWSFWGLTIPIAILGGVIALARAPLG